MAHGDGIARDLIAGLTVTLVGIPQCLAYALMAGLPPAYGLSTAAIAGFVAAVVGKSAHVATGPTNTTGLLILVALTPFLGENGLLDPTALGVLATLTLLAGVIRVAGGLLGAAHLVRFLPESVLAGFTAGAGVLIGVMQLDEWLGLQPVRSDGFGSQLSIIYERIAGGELPSLAAVLVGIGTIAALALGRRWLPRWPTALVVVAATAALAATGIFPAGALQLVSDRGAVPSGWPPLALPSLEPSLLGRLLLPSAAIVLLGTLELTVSVRAHDRAPNMKREILAQGAANIVGAFIGCFPASASLTRSALLVMGRARTRLAAGISAVFSGLVLLFAGSAVGYIPQAALAGVLLYTAYGMVDLRRLGRIWSAATASRVLLVVTFVATLTLPLEWAILLGAGLGLAFHLASTSDPRARLFRVLDGRLTPYVPGDDVACFVVEVSGTLYYAAAPTFVERLEAQVPLSAARVVIDVEHAHQLRYSAIEAFEKLRETLHARGQKLVLASVSTAFADVLEQTGSKLPFTRLGPTPGEGLRAAITVELG